MHRRNFVAGLGLLFAVSGPAAAQQLIQSPVLTIDPERFYLDSAFGRSVLAEIDRRSQTLATENKAIEVELEQEEQALKELRPTLAPDEFRALADAFDARVQSIRIERETEARAISQLLDDNRSEFLRAAEPVLEQIMRDLGAGVVLDVNIAYASANAIDITDRAIAGVNAVLPKNPDE